MSVTSYKNTKEKSKALDQMRDKFVSEYDLKKADKALKNTPDTMELRDARTMLRVALEKVQAHNTKIKKMETRIARTSVKEL